MATSVEAELVRLRTENAELRAGLEARTQENALLLQMIADVISTLKLDQVLRHIVEHLVGAFGCHAAFVYLWEPERERLVLRAASDQYRHVAGRIELAHARDQDSASQADHERSDPVRLAPQLRLDLHGFDVASLLHL